METLVPVGARAPTLATERKALLYGLLLLLFLKAGCVASTKQPLFHASYVLLAESQSRAWLGREAGKASLSSTLKAWDDEMGNSANIGKVSKGIGGTKSMLDVHSKLPV